MRERVVFIDFETTGLDARSGEKIVEIGAFKIDERGKKFSFHSLVNPQRDISFSARGIHNISEEMLKMAPTMEEILPLFLNFIEEGYICGYNLDFDLSFLEGYVERYFFTEHRFIDVLAMSRYCFRDFEKFSLGNVCRRLNIEYPLQHRALQDAIATSKVFFRCWEVMKNRGMTGDVKTLAEKFGPDIVRKYENSF